MLNSTLTDDIGALGGGVYNNAGTATLTGVTLWNERSGYGRPGGALDNAGPSGSFRVAGSIVAEPGGYRPAGCTGAITAPAGGDGAHNVVTDASCSTGAADTVSSAADINLQPLADNGSTGPQTLGFRLPSSAFEAVPTGSGFCLPTDERGLPRPGVPGHDCDAGAYESQGAPTGPPSCGCGSTAAGTQPRRGAPAAGGLGRRGLLPRAAAAERDE